ncbi:MAG: nucleotidyltransferase family protein [Bacteroidales bacterium]|nr:nucleotidyltransferase family protein [Bacteroidales bacterium]
MDHFSVFTQLMLLGLGLREKVPQALRDLLEENEDRKTQCLQAVYQLSQEQGFPSVVYDGLQRVFSQGEYTIGEELNYEWFGACLGAEMTYAAQEKTLSYLACFYRYYGMDMMLLKGFGLCPLYPVPNHRPLGDIDIWLFGDLEKGDRLLEEKLGIRVEKDKEHHTVFSVNGIMVENHYEFINLKSHWSNRLFHDALERLGRENPERIRVDRGELFLPSPTFNAVFLFRHLAQHYMGAGINFRQLADWVLFLKRDASKVDWPVLIDLVEKSGCKPFYRAVMGLSVHFFGLSPEHLPAFERAPQWEEQVVQDMLLDNATVRGSKLSDRLARFRHQRRKISLVIQESALMTFIRTGLQSIKYSMKD